MSDNPTNWSLSTLRAALRRVPKVDVDKLIAEMAAQKPSRLTSMQTRLAVAHLNRFLRAEGLKPITAEDVAGARVKAAPGGCLDPTKGLLISSILDLIDVRKPRGVAVV